MLIEVELYQIVITEGSATQGIVLKEKSGERSFPIFIGYNEAMAIDRKIKDFQVPRPLTHDLLQSVIEKMGGKLERIVLNDLREGTYYALLVIQHEGQAVEVDSRPSDAIALAVRMDVPIFVDDQVLNRAIIAD